MNEGATVVATSLLSICTLSFLLAESVEFLEPNVQRHVGVLPPSVCKQLIELGENCGFLVMELEESIDEDDNDPTKKIVPAQQIDIYDNASEPGVDDVAVIENEAIWNVIQPWIPRITEIVKKNRDEEEFIKYYPNEPEREPDLNWVFFRKYSPHSERNSLKVHHDTNMNTVNIELSDDYNGGGLFYIKPLASTGKVAGVYTNSHGYIDYVKRENTTEIVFPDLHTGDAIFYNYTVEHGVAPVDSGTRYSMAFFYDMDNPAVRDDFASGSSEDEEYGYNSADKDGIEFTVELHNGLSDMVLDFVRVYDAALEEEVWEKIFEKVAPDEVRIYHSYGGDWLMALVEGTTKAVSEIEIRRDLSVYTVSEMKSLDQDMFQVELHNGLPGMALDLVLVYDAEQQKGVWEIVFDRVTPGETTIYEAYEGDRIWAMIEGTDEAVSEIEIKPDQSVYIVSEIVYLLSSEL